MFLLGLEIQRGHFTMQPELLGYTRIIQPLYLTGRCLGEAMFWVLSTHPQQTLTEWKSTRKPNSKNQLKEAELFLQGK